MNSNWRKEWLLVSGFFLTISLAHGLQIWSILRSHSFSQLLNLGMTLSKYRSFSECRWTPIYPHCTGNGMWDMKSRQALCRRQLLSVDSVCHIQQKNTCRRGNGSHRIIGSPKLEKTSPIIQFNRPPTTKSPSNLSTDRLSQILPCLGEENKASRSFKVLWLGAASAYTKMYLQQLYYKPQKFIRVLKSLLSGFLYPALLNVHTPQTTLETLC